MSKGDILESLIQNIGDLDITNTNDFNLESLQEALQISQKDELFSAALSQGLDLKEYNNSIETDLAKLEWDSVNDYLEQTNELVGLHSKIKASDKLLQDMGTVLSVFEGDLRSVSADIDLLQQQSRRLALQLANRRRVREDLSSSIDSLIIPPDLIHGLSGEVNEGYVKHCEALYLKLKHTHTAPDSSLAAVDLYSSLDLLRLMTVRKLRDFLISLVYSLRKPKTNVQILQHNVLVKYSFFNKFLFTHAPVYAMEIRDSYIDTVHRTFASYFGNYITNLSKLQYPTTTAADLLAKDESQSGSKKIFGKKGTKPKTPAPQVVNSPKGRSNIYDPTTHGHTHISRTNILASLDTAPAIIPHVSAQANTKYSYENLFRSMHRLLVDTVCSEQLFVMEWFPKQILHGSQGSPNPDQLFLPIFSKCLGLLQDDLTTFLPQCFDPIGLLLMIKITQHSAATMVRRNINIPPFTLYLQHMLTVLWDRFNKLLDKEMNVESVRTAAAKYGGGAKDTTPNAVVRRYAEFLASLLVINHYEVEAHMTDAASSPQVQARIPPPSPSLSRLPQSSKGGDTRVDAWLTVLRTSIEKLLDTIAYHLDPRPRPVFLINNYDLIISVLREQGVDSDQHGDDGTRFRYNLKVETAQFVEIELHNFYPRLIEFVKASDSMLIKDPNSFIDKKTVEQLAKEFASNWKEVLAKINSDVMNFFPNFELGSDILKQVLSQLVLYYKRFEEIHRKCFRSPAGQGEATDAASGGVVMGKSLVPISTITYEITKKYSSFA